MRPRSEIHPLDEPVTGELSEPRLVRRLWERPALRAAGMLLPRSPLRRRLIADFVPRVYERFNAGEIPYQVFHRRVKVIQTGALIDTAGTFHGHEGLEAALAELSEAFEEIRFRAESFTEVGRRRLLLLARFSGRGKMSGLPTHRRVGHLFTMRRGYIRRWEVYWDAADGLKAAGLNRASPAG